MSNYLKSYFLIRGDFEKEEVIQFLGITPVEAWNMGEQNQKELLPRCSYISINESIREGNAVDLYSVAEEIVDSLRSYTEKLKEAKIRWNLEYTLQMSLESFSKGSPAIGLESETIKFLSSIGASYDVDMYSSD